MDGSHRAGCGDDDDNDGEVDRVVLVPAVCEQRAGETDDEFTSYRI